MDAFYHLRTAWRCCLVLAFSASAITACSSVGQSAPSNQANEGRSAASRGGTAAERFKTEVERVVAMRLGDPDSVGKHLHTHLSQVTGDGTWNEWRAERGMLGNLEISNISLRIDDEDASRASLFFDVVPPGIKLGYPLWEDAVPYPARPDASGSRPYWSVKVRGLRVYLGLDVDFATLEHVTIVQR